MTGRTAQAIRHIGFEDLGSIAGPLREAGYDIEYIDVAERELATLDSVGADLLVVLRGPVSVYDHDAYPIVTDETRLLRVRLPADRLMAAALGARVYPGPAKEIGWSALDLSDTAAPNPLAVLQDVPVLHWYGDTFDLPEGGTLLAYTALCTNQAFSRGPNVLDLQFHPEVLGARFEHWLLGHANELATAGIDPVTLRRDAGRHASRLEQAGAALLTDWLTRLTR